MEFLDKLFYFSLGMAPGCFIAVYQYYRRGYAEHVAHCIKEANRRNR